MDKMSYRVARDRFIVEQDGELIAEFPYEDRSRKHLVQFMAAPELLEACQRAGKLLSELMAAHMDRRPQIIIGDTDMQLSINHAIRETAAAIAKAEGRD